MGPLEGRRATTLEVCTSSCETVDCVFLSECAKMRMCEPTPTRCRCPRQGQTQSRCVLFMGGEGWVIGSPPPLLCPSLLLGVLALSLISHAARPLPSPPPPAALRALLGEDSGGRDKACVRETHPSVVACCTPC